VIDRVAPVLFPRTEDETVPPRPAGEGERDPLKRRRAVIVVGALVASVTMSCTGSSPVVTPSVVTPTQPPPSPSQVPSLPDGAFRVHPCAGDPADRCGSIDAPRRWSHPDGSTIRVRFRVIERGDPDAVAQEPIVAMEGGPGYGSIGSAASYRMLFGPLLRTRDLILMDQRGTGGSEAIDCPALQQGRGDYADAVAACAEQLGEDANTYGSAAAADDLAAILEGLGIDRVDVYGDSYGTYLAQVFALRHAAQVRSLVLDGAYDDGFDPFARDAAAALARSWATLCRRAGMCPDILDDIRSLAEQLADEPLVGVGTDGAGNRRHVRVTDADLAQLLYDAAYTFTIYRDIPAAVEALRSGDATPFLRLAAEDLGSLGGGGNPRFYSEGAYAAVACHDYPTLWDRSGSPEERRTQLEEAISALPDDAFAPLPNAAWLGSAYEYQLVYGCLGWPAPVPGLDDPAQPTAGPHPDLPVLVLNGEFDITTPVANARTAASAWPDATFVEVANEIHITALYDVEGCASRIVRRFIRTLDAGDTSCARRTPRIRVVDTFPGRGGAPEATAVPGDASTAADRRTAWVVAETVGDAFTRWWNVSSHGVGLRGGTFTTYGRYLDPTEGLVLTLHDARFTDDVSVSGRIVWFGHTGLLRGTMRVHAPHGEGLVHLRGSTRGPSRPATLTGTIAGRPLHVSVPALWSP
jgi:pimeloyl-ACP methyl ester carboxylesterase